MNNLYDLKFPGLDDRRSDEYTRCSDCPIRALALFNKVPLENLQWTQEYRRSQIVFSAGDHLFRQGEYTDDVYTLFLGWVKIYKYAASGKNQTMRFSLPGDFLGFQGDVAGPVGYSAQALTNCIVCAFPRNRMMELMGREPNIAAQLINMNFRAMSVYQEYLISTGTRTTKEAIAFLLLELVHRLRLMTTLQTPMCETNTYEIPITQSDIGEAVGATQIHVNRVLQEMKHEGLLRCANGQLEIIDESTLIRLASFDAKSIGYFEGC